VLLVARGTSARPAFESVALSEQADGQPQSIMLAASVGGVLLGSTASQGAGADGQPLKGAKQPRHNKQDVTVGWVVVRKGGAGICGWLGCVLGGHPAHPCPPI